MFRKYLSSLSIESGNNSIHKSRGRPEIVGSVSIRLEDAGLSLLHVLLAAAQDLGILGLGLGLGELRSEFVGDLLGVAEAVGDELGLD